MDLVLFTVCATIATTFPARISELTAYQTITSKVSQCYQWQEVYNLNLGSSRKSSAILGQSESQHICAVFHWISYQC